MGIDATGGSASDLEIEIMAWRSSRIKPHKRGSEADLRMQGELYAVNQILNIIRKERHGT